jgi:hypothetical protein
VTAYGENLMTADTRANCRLVLEKFFRRCRAERPAIDLIWLAAGITAFRRRLVPST